MLYKNTKRRRINGNTHHVIENNAQYHKYVSFPKVNQKCNIIPLTIWVIFLNHIEVNSNVNVTQKTRKRTQENSLRTQNLVGDQPYQISEHDKANQNNGVLAYKYTERNEFEERARTMKR